MPKVLYMSSTSWLLGVSWVTWFFLCWEIKNCMQRWANSQNNDYFHSKWFVLSENSCHCVNLHSFASSAFFLSLRKTTGLNSQQPKTRGHVEHPRREDFFQFLRTPDPTTNSGIIYEPWIFMKFSKKNKFCKNWFNG